MKWRILIVDDEPDVRLIIRTTLEPRYEVVEAHDGLDALEKVERYEPDFVLMDVMMPLMNGFDACAAIRKSQKFAELPVMFLSALSGKDDIRKGYASGANLYLTKPFDPSRLLKNIDVFFEKTPPARRNRRYTIEQLRHAEKEGIAPAAPGAPGFETEPIVAEPSTPSRAANVIPPTAPMGGSRASVEVSLPGSDQLARVLVVDDDQEIISLIRMTLDGIAEVVSASDGLEAIEKLVKYQPDILILDIMLPKMNGLQLCQSLRSNRAFGRLPIIVCSARGNDRDIQFAKRMGANDYVVKPFSPSDMIAKIKETTKKPGFRPSPKNFTLAQIQDMENASQKKDVFQQDDDARRSENPNEGRKALKNFLSKEGDRDALEAEPVEEKKKRRFFGFGG